MTDTEKVRENRLRRLAYRQGFTLAKSRARDTRDVTWGTYMLVDPYTRSAVAADHAFGRGYGLDLDEIEQWLNEWAAKEIELPNPAGVELTA